MPNPIKIKRSDTLSAVPSALEAGELAINRRDKKLFYTDHLDVVQSMNLVGGSGASVYSTEIDFGVTPLAEKIFTIAHSGMTTSHNIICSLSYKAPTSKDQDEVEMDDLVCKAVAGTNDFTLYVTSADGSYLADKFIINYTFS